MKPKQVIAAAAVLMLVAFVGGASYFKAQEAARVETLASESATTLAPPHAMTLGPADAKVQLVEFFDPACETCALFHGPVKELMAAHPGRIQLVLRYAPFHAGSGEVVKILEAARAQDKYWEVLELLFASQSAWASHHHPRPELIWEFLPRTGVDIEQLRADMGDFTLDALIERDLADAEALGIRKTPGFLVNGKPLPSFGLRQLQELVEAEIAAAY
jgi:protein-disulfide isomerase